MAWDSAGTTSWAWELSKVASGDHNSDGKADIAVWYESSPAADGRTRHALWNFTNAGDGMTAPHRDWYSVPQ
ncbi:hypothetical protein ACIF9R_29070 [Streptomyces sp. NPDC086080]|uniref:hypothetical protein n=1 Tax=Streptomyces sp. NPDC086080 TaxID=3365748 RepID=UPI0037D52304